MDLAPYSQGVRVESRSSFCLFSQLCGRSIGSGMNDWKEVFHCYMWEDCRKIQKIFIFTVM